jgi:homoserine dehydrogenase
MNPSFQSPDANAARPPLCVLKFGSSVLADEGGYPAVALEIYRHVRNGEKVLAVVSALAGQTDALLAQAGRVGGESPPPALVARVARVGELHSAALLALALHRIGVRACSLDPHEMGLVASGEPLDSDLTDVDAATVWKSIAAHDVVVVPGFIADHADHGVVTLGRGGTDLSAVFFAARLDAHRVRLIKDVDGVYAKDPATNPDAERYAELSYAAAQEASSGLIQPKAIHAAEAEDVIIEIASLASAEATRIAHLEPRTSRPVAPQRLRVSLLGHGCVGAGVLDYLHANPDLFEVGPVLVRDPAAHSGKAQFSADVDGVLAFDADILVEAVGGADFPVEPMRVALLGGAEVVTANKAALARHWDSLHASALRGGGGLHFSGAVGGGVPVIEALRRLDGVTAIEGVMNGTCNFILCRMAEGWTFTDALAEAQAQGFAEADPSADLDGHDAADKLSILAREAFESVVPPPLIAKQSLRDLPLDAAAEAAAIGRVLRQVARCVRRPDGSVGADVRVVALPLDHPLAKVRNEENRFLVTDEAGRVHDLYGKGAGRWPTAAAVFADLMDAQRALLARGPRASREPRMRLSA